MGPLAPQDTTELTLARARRTILPVVEYVQTDGREVLRRLLREGRFGGTVAPDVQGTVTLSLRNVAWETALQTVTRQLDATYRVDHGFFEIVRREDSFPPLPTKDDWPRVETRQAIEAGYRALRDGVLNGRRESVRSRLANFLFENNLGHPVASGRAAVERLIAHERGNPEFTILGYRRSPQRFHRVAALKVQVAYGKEDRYEDLWIRGQGQAWSLYRRREGSMRFTNALLSDIAAALAESNDVTLVVDPRVDRKVTVDLSGGPFETALSRLTGAVGATYRIEGGVYRIVPRWPDRFEDIVDWLPMIADGPNEPIGARYGWMVDQVVTGRGAELRKWLGATIDANAFIATARAYPQFVPVYYAYSGTDVEAVVAFRDGNEEERRFRDLWRSDGKAWRLLSHTTVPANEGLNFYDARVKDILADFFAHHRQAVDVNEPIRGRATVYLEGLDFRTGLGKLLRAADLTYRVDNGRYRVSPLPSRR